MAKQNMDKRRIRSFIRNYWLRVWWFSLLLILFAASWSWAADYVYFPIQNVQIESNLQFLTEAQIESAIKSHMTDGFFSLKLGHMANQLQQLPWVKQVALRRLWPDTLVIKIVEQVPVAYWNKKYLLNQQGDIFAPNQLPQDFSLPSLYGLQQHSSRLLEMYHFINQKLAIFGILVDRLEEDTRQSVKLTLSNGIEIFLGYIEHEKRLYRLFRVLPKWLSQNNQVVTRIDLRYPHGLAAFFSELPIADNNF